MVRAAATGSPLCDHPLSFLAIMASLGAAEPAAASSADPLQYDLTTVVAKSLDRHLVFPLLEFLSQKQLYPAEDIESAKLELIEKTNMVDYAVDIYQGLNQTDEVRGLDGVNGVKRIYITQ